MDELDRQVAETLEATSFTNVGMPIRVRRGVLSDIPWMMKVAKDFHASLGAKSCYIYPSDEFIFNGMESMLNDCVLIAVKGDERVGVIAGKFVNHEFNPMTCVLGERFWWVEEKYRGSRAGYLLLKEFLKVGDENANMTILSLTDMSQMEIRQMERMGLMLKEYCFMRESP